MAETVKLSEYMKNPRNGRKLHPLKVDRALQEDALDDKNPLYGHVLPVKSYYGLEGDSVSTYTTRTEATDARKKNDGIKTFRDYLIFDTQAFETWLDSEENSQRIYNLRAGAGTPKSQGLFLEEEVALSYGEDARKRLLDEMRKAKLNKPKREVSPEQIAKMQAARGKGKGQSKSPARGKK